MARKILLADDSVTAQNMGRRILSDAGYEVTTVNNGSAALKKIAEHKPDLIVLDVYMPGYGGLEVCQRLKEARETARIPVLLTVGKLEPFKAEEAKRVRADAYLVKPFEASELLTALTKLEDKIVPQAEPYKPGRFAKVMASLDHPDTDDFGDKDSGWKDRLKIPTGAAKEEEEPQPVASSRSMREHAERTKLVETHKEFERPMPAGLPADITPEEISAISAAAAALQGEGNKVEPAEKPQKPEAIASTQAEEEKPVVPEAEGVAAAQEPAPEDTPPMTFAAGVEQKAASETVGQETEVSPEAQAEPAPQPDTSLEDTAELPVVPETIAESQLAEAAQATDTTVEPEPAAAAGKHTDAEVLAALAMLGSPNAAADANAEPAALSGPRWIAEEIALEPDESTLVLEREMEKAYAAMAAAEDAMARSLSAPAEVGAQPATADSGTVAVAEAPLPEPEEPQVAEVASAEPESPALEKAPEPDAAPAMVEPTATEAVAAETLVAEAMAAAETPVAPEPMAFAAAAAAGASVQPEVREVPEVAGSGTEASAANEHREAQLAAAWEHWKQARESSPQAETSQAPESALQEQETQATASTEPVTETGAESDAAQTAAEGESSELASIVDGMLAELKPKLMQEIAKKLGKKQ